MAVPLVDAVPPIKQPHGAPRKRADEVLANRAYDAESKIRTPLRKRLRRWLPIATPNMAAGSVVLESNPLW
jgi:hypothetical protein